MLQTMVSEENNMREYLGLFEEMESKLKLDRHKGTSCKKIKRTIGGGNTRKHPHPHTLNIHNGGGNGGCQ